MEIIRLDRSNWDTYSSWIMDLESTYPEAMRSELEDLEVLLDLSFILLLDKPIGLILGSPPSDVEKEEYGVEGNGIYIFDLVVDAAYQGKGFGKMLLEHFIMEAKKEGYDFIIGHFRPASASLFQKCGGRIVREEKNWEAGEDFLFCRLTLASS